jgi:cytoskeletal protein CcmA (bactofilin family)
MAIGTFSREIQEKQLSGDASGPGEAGGGGLVTFVGEGSEFDGTLRLKTAVRIDGDFRGNIASEDTVVVGETSGIEANIHSRNVIIYGAVAGDVVATRQLIVHRTGRLLGDVETPSLAIEPGAVFNGRSKMVRPDLVLRGRPRAEAPSTKSASVAEHEPAALAPSRPREGRAPERTG